MINQEKTIQNIEGFDKTKLRHADTQEKNPLPDKAGKILFDMMEKKLKFLGISMFIIHFTDKMHFQEVI